MVGRIEFVVENAGCASCAERVRAALEPLAVVREVDVDEPADIARVELGYASELSQSSVDDVLREASQDAGHAYQVRPGSWLVEAGA